MFKGKPSLHTFVRKHTRKHTTACTGSLAHIRQEREKGGGGGKIQRTESTHIVYSPMTAGSKKTQTKQGRAATIAVSDGSILRLRGKRCSGSSHHQWSPNMDSIWNLLTHPAQRETGPRLPSQPELAPQVWPAKMSKNLSLGCNFTPLPHVGSALHPAPSSGVRYNYVFGHIAR